MQKRQHGDIAERVLFSLDWTRNVRWPYADALDRLLSLSVHEVHGDSEKRTLLLLDREKRVGHSLRSVICWK